MVWAPAFFHGGWRRAGSSGRIWRAVGIFTGAIGIRRKPGVRQGSGSIPLKLQDQSDQREFGNRKGSKDILRLTYELESTDREQVARALRSLADEGFREAGDIDRTYAFSVSEGVKGQTRLQFALVIAHEKKNRSDRSSHNRIAAEIDDVHAIDVRLDKALREEGITLALSGGVLEWSEGIGRDLACDAAGRRGGDAFDEDAHRGASGKERPLSSRRRSSRADDKRS